MAPKIYFRLLLQQRPRPYPSNIPARKALRSFMQKLSRPARVAAAMIVAIMRSSSGLTIAPSSPLATAMAMKVWFMNFLAGSP